MNHTPPFATFHDLFAADPYELAASALDLFGEPKIVQSELQDWLRALVAEKGESILGMHISEPPPLEATEHKIVLIWERAVVAVRTLEGRDYAWAGLLLLEPGIRSLHFTDRVARLRA